MFKFLLCWRYLRTRYIALASVISVMLGVATMIVVNSVMAGFSHEMQDRLHGILSDVVFESLSIEGFQDPQWHMDEIRKVAGDDIEGMTATIAVPAMITFKHGGNSITRQVQLIGIDEHTQQQAGDFAKYLQHPLNREKFSFELRQSGYDVRDAQGGSDARERKAMQHAGWKHRRRMVELERAYRIRHADLETIDEGTEDAAGGPEDPFAQRKSEGTAFDPAKQQHAGLVLGMALSSYRDHEGDDQFLVLPGDDVQLAFPNAPELGKPPEVKTEFFTIVDLYESKMSEYDASFVFVPLEKLQVLRGQYDPQSDIGYATAIQMRVKPGVDLNVVRDKIRAAFRPELYSVSTWRDKQGPLLAAVQMETAILNVLLFMIIAVAGFGILAIFFMIVVEKTRDIGILKSLGASGRGIQGIFLAYGLSLGLVGSGVGMVLGLLFVVYINEIADGLAYITGQPVFDPSIYYFYKIPTIIEPFTVVWIVLGALAIAVMASILPARRASRLHPVEALRYE